MLTHVLKREIVEMDGSLVDMVERAYRLGFEHSRAQSIECCTMIQLVSEGEPEEKGATACLDAIVENVEPQVE